MNIYLTNKVVVIIRVKGFKYLRKLKRVWKMFDRKLIEKIKIYKNYYKKTKNDESKYLKEVFAYIGENKILF